MSRRRKYNYHKDAFPTDGEVYVYVFDSNTAGLHSTGNALIARDMFQATFGVGEGITSAHSYAIPFKDRFIRLLSLKEIAHSVDKFVAYTKERPDVKFWVSLIGVGKREYSNHQIAPMFSGCGDNCILPYQWVPYLR